MITTHYIPVVANVFREYKESSNPFLPTTFLNSELQKNPRGLERLCAGFNSTYRIYRAGGAQVILVINNSAFSMLIVPANSIDPTVRTTNFSVSANRQLNMYMYGLKANGLGPKVSGNELNATAVIVCRAMHIKKVYIYDAAGISCFWNPAIEIDHFSILRVLVGRPAFYESMPGEFFNAAAAAAEKQLLQRAISPEEKEYIIHYLDAVETNRPPSPLDRCERVRHIVHKALALLGPSPAIFSYVATPYSRGSLGDPDCAEHVHSAKVILDRLP